MAVTTVAFADLSTWLQAQPVNTPETAYELNITGLVATNIRNSSISGTLGYILNANNTKYVDLSETSLPNGVENITRAFSNCSSLTQSPKIPSSVTGMTGTFAGCTSLTQAPVIPANVPEINSTFYHCSSLTQAPVIPKTVTNMSSTFSYCTSLTETPAIPSSVTNMSSCFYGCTSLITANLKNPTNISTSTQSDFNSMFYNCTALTTIKTDLPYSTKNWLTAAKAANNNFLPNAVSAYNIVMNTPAEIPFSLLNDELQNLPVNTAQTAYQIKVTELVAADIGNSSTSGTLGYVIKTNNTKYVDLSETILPSGVTILEGAFRNCTSLTKAPAIPNGVTSMKNCFRRCMSLTETSVIPNGVTNMESCFSDCTSLTEAPAIPSSVSNLSFCFYSCFSLTKAPVIHNGVTDMSGCFMICTSLTEAPVIPSSVTNMESCFNGCTALTEAPVIPNSVTNLLDCFDLCTALTETPVIPNNVTKVSYCFNGCTSLITANLKYPPNISTATSSNFASMFEGCTALTTINTDVPYSTKNWLTAAKAADSNFLPNAVSAYNIVMNTPAEIPFSLLNTELQHLPANSSQTAYQIKVVDLTSSDIGDSSTSGTLGNVLRANGTKYVDVSSTIMPSDVIDLSYCFKNCISLTKAPAIPNGVTNMGHCFDTCYALTESPVIPSSVTDMNNCFAQCLALTEAPVIPNGVTDITECFRQCSALTEAPVIPNGITSLYGCFEKCSALLEAPVIPNRVTSLEKAFDNCRSLTEAPVIPNSVTNLTACFSGCILLEKAPVIPNRATSMEGCFSSCTALTEAPVIPSSVTNMESCFNGCTSLTEAPAIPSSVSNLSFCFYSCSSLTKAPVIHNGVTNMKGCFFQCSALTDVVTIPSSVTNIKELFFRATNVTAVKFENPTDITVLEDAFFSSSIDTIFSDLPYETKSWVIENSAALGLPVSISALNFKLISSPVEFPIAKLSNELGALTGNTVGTPFEITVTGLTDQNYSSLTTALTSNNTKFVDLSTTQIPNTITDVSMLFSDCVSLIKSPVLPSAATTLAETFSGCTNLSEAPAVPSNVTSMLKTFVNCTSLEEAPEIPLGVANLAETFRGCSALEEAPTIPNTVTNMARTFQGCTTLVSPPAIPSNVTTLSGCFKGCSALETAPLLNSGLTDVSEAFMDCEALVVAPDIPTGVTNLSGAFDGCSALEGAADIPAGVVNISRIYKDCALLTEIPEIPDTVANMSEAFEGCSAVEIAPNVPSSVTNLTRAFKDCTALEEVTLFEAPATTLQNNATDCFSGCTALTKLGVNTGVAEASDWHIFKLKIDDTSVKGKVFDRHGVGATIAQTTINKTVLKLPIKTDELWFPDIYTDQEIEELITSVLSNKYSWFVKKVIAPDKKSFVLWADDPNTVITNINTGGGGDAVIPVMCTSALSESKTVSISGFTLKDGAMVEVFFVNGHYVSLSSDAFTLNINALGAKKIYACKDGSQILMPNHSIERSESGDSQAHNWYIQPNTTLKLMYLSSLDNNNGGFVIIGNPIVLSSADYVIYANGFYKWNSISTTQERWTGKFWTDGKPIYCKTDYASTISSSIGYNISTPNIETLVATKQKRWYGASEPYWVMGDGTYGRNTYYFEQVPNFIGFQFQTSTTLREVTTIVYFTKTTDTAGTIPPFSN